MTSLIACVVADSSRSVNDASACDAATALANIASNNHHANRRHFLLIEQLSLIIGTYDALSWKYRSGNSLFDFVCGVNISPGGCDLWSTRRKR